MSSPAFGQVIGRPSTWTPFADVTLSEAQPLDWVTRWRTRANLIKETSRLQESLLEHHWCSSVQTHFPIRQEINSKEIGHCQTLQRDHENSTPAKDLSRRGRRPVDVRVLFALWMTV